MSDFLSKGLKYTNITVDKGDLQIDEASIAGVTEQINRLITQQQLAMEQRMLTHLMRPAMFLNVVAGDDGIETRARYWSTSVKHVYGTFYINTETPPRLDPLDAKHDGVTLRELLSAYAMLQREHHLVQYNARGDLVRYGAAMPAWFMRRGGFTPAQRAAVSSHWSAELRAKVAASEERERNEVRCDLQDEP